MNAQHRRRGAAGGGDVTKGSLWADWLLQQPMCGTTPAGERSGKVTTSRIKVGNCGMKWPYAQIDAVGILPPPSSSVVAQPLRGKEAER